MQQCVALEIEMQSEPCYDYFTVPSHSTRKEEVGNCVCVWGGHTALLCMATVD